MDRGKNAQNLTHDVIKRTEIYSQKNEEDFDLS